MMIVRQLVNTFYSSGIFGLICFHMCACSPDNPNESETNFEENSDFCSQIHSDSSISLSRQLEPIKNKMVDSTGLYVLEEGEGSLIARAWLTENAEKSIDVQYFIFSTDNVGLIACDYLVRAADRGIPVRILVDDIMVEADPEELLTMQSHPNISIKIYNPNVNTGKNLVSKIYNTVKDFQGINQRMHNKAVIVDGNLVITGGRNMEDAYYDFDHRYNYRDRDVLLIGGMAPQVQNSFNLFWNDSLCVDVDQIVEAKDEGPEEYKKRLNDLHEYACNPDNFWPQIREKIKFVPNAFEELNMAGAIHWIPNEKIQYVSDDPGKNDGSMEGGGKTTSKLIELVQAAKDSIIMQTPYLVTTEISRNLFASKVSEGVKIKILTNSLASTDGIEAFSGYQRDRKKLLETGVEVYEFKPDAEVRMKLITGDLQKKLDYTPIFGLHAKSMVIDGNTTVIATFNLDPRSANLNTECLTIIESEAVATQVLERMEEEFLPANAWRITEDFNPDSLAGMVKNMEVTSRLVIPKKIL